MVAKDVRFSTDARDRILRGVEILNNAVKITLGPKRRNVVIEKSYGAPRISRVSVRTGNGLFKKKHPIDTAEQFLAQHPWSNRL